MLNLIIIAVVFYTLGLLTACLLHTARSEEP